MSFFIRTEQDGAVVPVKMSDDMSTLDGYLAVGVDGNNEAAFTVVPEPEQPFDIIKLRVEADPNFSDTYLVNQEDRIELWEHIFGSKKNRPFYAYLADTQHLKNLGPNNYDAMELMSIHQNPASSDRVLMFSAFDPVNDILYTVRYDLTNNRNNAPWLIFTLKYKFTKA